MFAKHIGKGCFIRILHKAYFLRRGCAADNECEIGLQIIFRVGLTPVKWKRKESDLGVGCIYGMDEG